MREAGEGGYDDVPRTLSRQSWKSGGGVKVPVKTNVELLPHATASTRRRERCTETRSSGSWA